MVSGDTRYCLCVPCCSASEQSLVGFFFGGVAVTVLCLGSCSEDRRLPDVIFCGGCVYWFCGGWALLWWISATSPSDLCLLCASSEMWVLVSPSARHIGTFCGLRIGGCRRL
ncbi:hypothetical protein OIU84_015990 [Salix udensis]|uniref:Uncharacterized protein n=1 Tax=Salix udensis TaxID=889485 RepID=A0AAD6JAA5_9ROSI|nr:hypothetical protein OIU84_015990 [Salix udensis]